MLLKLTAGVVLSLAMMAGSAQALGLQQIGNFEEPIYLTSDPGNPERLFDLAFVSMSIAKASGDDRVADPIAVDCLATALVAISELLGFAGEARQ